MGSVLWTEPDAWVFTPLLRATVSATVSDAKPSSKASSRADAALAGVRVLLVDDDEDGRELVAMVLAQCGAIVTHAGTAAEAFAAFEAEAPHLLISDIALPGEDGHTLLRRIRAVEVTRGGHVTAVAISGYGRTPDGAEPSAGGFAAHLTKPVGRAQLVRTLTAVLQGTAPAHE